MKKIIALVSGSLMYVSFLSAQNYPVAHQVDQIDDYFGTKVSDPYRWLEDDNSKETTDWVKAENKVTEAYLSAIPFREKIRQRLTKLWNFPKSSTPFKGGKNY